MPNTQPAPAAPGNQAPSLPPSLRRPPPANIPRTPRPIARRRDVKPHYPDLPQVPHSSRERGAYTEFDRAHFLRQLAQLRAADPVCTKACCGNNQPLAHFLIGAVRAQEAATADALHSWMESCGGMAVAGSVQ